MWMIGGGTSSKCFSRRITFYNDKHFSKIVVKSSSSKHKSCCKSKNKRTDKRGAFETNCSTKGDHQRVSTIVKSTCSKKSKHTKSIKIVREKSNSVLTADHLHYSQKNGSVKNRNKISSTTYFTISKNNNIYNDIKIKKYEMVDRDTSTSSKPISAISGSVSNVEITNNINNNDNLGINISNSSCSTVDRNSNILPSSSGNESTITIMGQQGPRPSTTISNPQQSSAFVCDNNNDMTLVDDNTQSSDLLATPSTKTKKKSRKDKGDGSSKKTRNPEHKRRKVKIAQTDYSKIERPEADGAEDIDFENDPEAAEWVKLRCTSERTEVVAEREIRRQKRCADYPGLAFGRSVFSSDTMMKFNIIRNELHNIMKTQLKRVTPYANIFY